MTSMKIAASLAALLAGPAMAQEAPPQPLCGQWTVVRDNLKKNVGMVEVGGGMINENAALVIVANPEGDWASLAVAATGMACLMAQGQGWFAMPQSKGNPA